MVGIGLHRQRERDRRPIIARAVGEFVTGCPFSGGEQRGREKSGSASFQSGSEDHGSERVVSG